MSRFAEALKRARSGSVDDDDHIDRAGDAIRFFAPGQPAIVSPWNLDRDTGAPPAAEPAKPARPERHVAPLLLEQDRHSPARIRFPTERSSEKLIVSPAVSPIVREQYNKLAAAVHQSQLDRSLKVVMITSAVPHEGKTLTASNLALTLSESYERRVLLIDGDLRHPTVHSVFGVPNVRGLSDSLAAHGPLPLLEINSKLWVLTAGSSGGDPMKTLTSDRMRMLIEEARVEFDWVLVDTPPIGLLPDASLVASMADGTLFVVLAGNTPYDVIQRAAEAVGGDRILGVVMNAIAEYEVPSTSYYGDYYYRRK